jgi:hypothetical protein
MLRAMKFFNICLCPRKIKEKIEHKGESEKGKDRKCKQNVNSLQLLSRGLNNDI